MPRALDPKDKDSFRDAIRQQVLGQMEKAMAGKNRLPEGTITLVFTDIVDSSGIMTRLGEKAANKVSRDQDALIRDVVAKHEGIEVERTGDSFMLAFTSARGALECAVDIQRAVARYDSEHPEARLMVRIGVDTGEVIAEEKGYFGKTVIRASRIMGIAQGDRIVVSAATRELLWSEEFDFADLGEHELKGFGSHRLYEVAWQQSP
jgi:class 3 adenylate cyclase